MYNSSADFQLLQLLSPVPTSDRVNELNTRKQAQSQAGNQADGNWLKEALCPSDLKCKCRSTGKRAMGRITHFGGGGGGTLD